MTFSVPVIHQPKFKSRTLAVQIHAGTSAYDYPMNLRFHQTLTGHSIPHDFREYPGGHVWETVARAIPAALDFLEANLIRGIARGRNHDE